MRKFILPLVLLAVWAIPSAARADSVTYNLVLTNITGNVAGGGGSFTISTPPSTALNSVSTYYQSNNSLTDLTINIDGKTFTLADGTGAYAQFISGGLTDITYLGYEATLQLSLSANGLEYQFYEGATGDSSVGSVSATVVPVNASAPEPSSIFLFGTGVLGLAFVSRKFVAA
jgi:hypothetical protein